MFFWGRGCKSIHTTQKGVKKTKEPFVLGVKKKAHQEGRMDKLSQKLLPEKMR